jgi:group I intron endonuclease
VVCVYAIKNFLNGKMYIGSAVNFNNRVKMHISQLKRSVHHSVKLQRAVNKYGMENFEFIVLEEVCREDLMIKEQHYINLHSSYNNGYNSQPLAFSSLGLKRSEAWKKQNKERQTGVPKSKSAIASQSHGLRIAYRDRGVEINRKRIASRSKYVESQFGCNFEYLENEYSKNKKSIITISDELGKHPTTIRKWLKRFGIPVRSVEERNLLISQKLKQ